MGPVAPISWIVRISWLCHPNSSPHLQVGEITNPEKYPFTIDLLTNFRDPTHIPWDLPTVPIHQSSASPSGPLIIRGVRGVSGCSSPKDTALLGLLPGRFAKVHDKGFFGLKKKKVQRLKLREVCDTVGGF